MIRSFPQRAGLAATLGTAILASPVATVAIKPRIDEWAAAAAAIADERIGPKAH